MHKQHDDRRPEALAHGPAKASDIERVRRDIARAEEEVARHLAAALARERRTSATPNVRARASPPAAFRSRGSVADS